MDGSGAKQEKSKSGQAEFFLLIPADSRGCRGLFLRVHPLFYFTCVSRPGGSTIWGRPRCVTSPGAPLRLTNKKGSRYLGSFLIMNLGVFD